jgi:hypothetical protein
MFAGAGRAAAVFGRRFLVWRHCARADLRKKGSGLLLQMQLFHYQ